MDVKVKICGLSRPDDIACAVEAGADMVGFIFAPSPRRVTPVRVQELITAVPAHVFKVGVFVNEELETVQRIVEECALDFAQLHGSESPAYCEELGPIGVKVIRVGTMQDIACMAEYPCKVFVLDTYDPHLAGGTGRAFDHAIAVKAREYGDIILAGGLNADNVAEAVRNVQPWGVDVSSGVEHEKGIKDHERIREFIKRAKEGA